MHNNLANANVTLMDNESLCPYEKAMPPVPPPPKKKKKKKKKKKSMLLIKAKSHVCVVPVFGYQLYTVKKKIAVEITVNYWQLSCTVHYCNLTLQ